MWRMISKKESNQLTLFTFFCKFVVKFAATLSCSLSPMVASSFPAMEVALAADKA